MLKFSEFLESKKKLELQFDTGGESQIVDKKRCKKKKIIRTFNVQGEPITVNCPKKK